MTMTAATTGARDSVASMPGEVMPRDAEIKKSEDSGIEKAASEFSCCYQNAKGVLQAGSEGIYFRGMMFFFERQLKLRWIDVIKVIKGNKGFMLVTQDSNHEFREVTHLDRCWATLVSLHSEALHGGGVSYRSYTDPRKVPPLRNTLRRTTSDPLAEVRHAEDEAPVSEEASYVAAASLANLKEAREHFSTRKLPAYKSIRMPPSAMTPHPEIEGDDIVEDIEDAWMQLQEPADEGYSDCALKDHELACNLQTFFDLFIADEAKHGLPTFLESNGDEDLVTSTWEAQEEGSPLLVRTIEYSHPVNAPLAPPKARAKKEQRFRRYGDHGISIETDTYVQDVPMTDCFYVTDRVLVEPRDGKVLVLAEFDIRFVKSTMFRSVITNTTRSEFIKYFTGMFEFMSEIIEGKPPEKKVKFEAPPAPPQGVVSPLLASTTHVTILLLVIVLVFQVWMMRQMQAMMSAMLAMQQEMIQACPAMARHA